MSREAMQAKGCQGRPVLATRSAQTMKPLAMTLTNVGPFPQLEWEIPEGITAISGDNGAGKSTLIGAIELALFAVGSRDLAPKMGSFGDKLEITLTFEHNDQTYRVRRGYKKGKATLDLEKWEDEE